MSNKCKHCDTDLNKKGVVFCGSSCAASYNNKHRKSRTEVSKLKTTTSLKKYYTDLTQEERLEIRNACANRQKICVIYTLTCKICNKIFIRAHKKGNVSHKTCSRECRIIGSTQNRSYQNGSRKPQYFFCRSLEKNVFLESSWEVRVAQELDSLNIAWVRPEPIKYNNSTKDRYYYPDFYLPAFDLYLDPKNPYCLKQDEQKMGIVKNLINIVYGDIRLVIDTIRSL